MDEQKERLFPQDGNYGSAYDTNGEKTNATRNYSVYTADYLGTLNFHLPMNIGSTFSFGGQGFYETEVLTAAIGKQFAGPGISTVSAASQSFGAENYTHAVQVGGLAQNRFAVWRSLLHDRRRARGWKQRLRFRLRLSDVSEGGRRIQPRRV